MFGRVLNTPVKQAALVKCRGSLLSANSIQCLGKSLLMLILVQFPQNTMLVKIFWNFTTFQYMFDLPQVKQVLITYLVEETYGIRVFSQVVKRLSDLPMIANQKMLKKLQIWSGDIRKEKQNFRNSNQNRRKRRFLALFNFAKFRCPALHAFPGWQV